MEQQPNNAGNLRDCQTGGEMHSISIFSARVMAAALASTALVALPVQAQSQDEVDAAPTEDLRDDGIATIIVTAERSEESVQTSSLSISVLDEETLAAVGDARDLGNFVSGVQITNGGVTLQSFVRGIGDFGSSALNQTAVSYNIDGVYVANTAEVSTQFFDLDRVEVLKGPQGTLYGRNSSAGAINLLVARPRLGEVGGNVAAEIGNYDAYRLTGAVNLPFGDNVAVRLSGNYSERDGYLSDGTDDDEQLAARLQILAEPSDAISVRIAGSIGHRGGNGPGAVPTNVGLPDFTGAVNAVANAAKLANSPVDYTPGAGLPPATVFTQTGLNRDMFLDIDSEEIHAEVIADLGFAEMTFIPSMRWSDSSVGTYASGAVFLNQEDISQESYELRLSGYHGIVDWVVGGYYLNLDQFTAAQIYQSLFVVVDQIADLDTESLAGFGQVTLNFTDSLRFIAGVRYTEEDRTIDAYAENSIPIFGTVTTFDIDSSATFNKWSWRGGVEYDLTPDNMLYFTASKGFKSGGFNIFEPTATITNAYLPETLYSYVIGARNRFLDDKVQFNIEAFYWDYKDSQQNRLAVTPSGALQFSTFNAASAELYGADMDLIVKPTANGTFFATVSFLETEFKDFFFETPFPSNPASNGCALDNSGPFTVDCSGFGLPRAAKWSGSAGYEHLIDLSNGAVIKLGGDMQFSSSRYLGTTYVPDEQAGGYAIFNAQISYTDPSDIFSVTAFVRNIEDEQVARGANLRSGIIYAEVAPPRTYGLRISARY